MAQLNINTIKNKRGDYGPNLVGHSTVTGDLTVTGTITGNITGDGSGLTGLGNTANIKSDTISNSGIITSTGFVGPLTGDVTGTTGTFSGDVTVGGTLTYEDVTNVDVVGMVTARKGIQVLADGINAVGIVTGTGFDGGSATISGVTTTSNLVVQNSAYTAITMTSINKTIVNREYCTVVTSSASTALNITITLPASPQPGWEVGVAVGGTFLDTQVGGNGSNIMGLAENMVLNVAYIPVQLVYVDANVGWRFF